MNLGGDSKERVRGGSEVSGLENAQAERATLQSVGNLRLTRLPCSLGSEAPGLAPPLGELLGHSSKQYPEEGGTAFSSGRCTFRPVQAEEPVLGFVLRILIYFLFMKLLERSSNLLQTGSCYKALRERGNAAIGRVKSVFQGGLCAEISK